MSSTNIVTFRYQAHPYICNMTAKEANQIAKDFETKRATLDQVLAEIKKMADVGRFSIDLKASLISGDLKNELVSLGYGVQHESYPTHAYYSISWY